MSTLPTIRRNPSAALLGVQLLGLLLYPLMESSPSGRALIGAFGLVVLAAARFALVVSRPDQHDGGVAQGLLRQVIARMPRYA